MRHEVELDRETADLLKRLTDALERVAYALEVAHTLGPEPSRSSDG